MPDWQVVHAAAGFWGADESDLFPLPVVAEAIGVGRNELHKLGIPRLTLAKRAVYRKSDVIGFLGSEEGERQVEPLQKKRKLAFDEAIAKARRDYYRRKWVRSLKFDARELGECLECAPWPMDEETESMIFEYRQVCANLRSEGAAVPRVPEDAWWLVEDDGERSKAHRQQYIAYLNQCIADTERVMREHVFDSRDYPDDSYNFDDWRRDLEERLALYRQDLATTLSQGC